MTRFLIDMKIWVDVLKGPDPTNDDVVNSLNKLLRSDQMIISVDLPNKKLKSFSSCRMTVTEAEGKARVIE